MDSNLNKDRNGSERATDIETTYTFEIDEDNLFQDLRNKMKSDIWQIFPSSCASLAGIPFGLMLGWPSPTYPTLLQPDSELPISLDQSALIAGFLMLGVSLGTLFSSRQIASCSKYGIILGNTLIVVGWALMSQSKNVYWLLGSRIVLGTGYGYALVQIKTYIKEMTEEELSDALVKVLACYTLTGFTAAYVIGPFVDFYLFSVIALIVSVFILFIAIFLPSTPKELIRSKRISDAKRLIAFLKPSLDPQIEAVKITESIDSHDSTNTLMDIYSNNTLKYNFLKFTLLVFCQQYSGIPPTLVYTQAMPFYF
ncbi:hypothetical protein GWI33_002167 [Rhynchophorus ferrugineus]|uniref:Uncharacterized protein n=1 Tax=Rhynchophorus ferrugineus TaxID=354439 RepID=A0A834IYS3_RHYFE|nr:hypothetical protein GWI33_002167 [Rhynchophorus ferrugineus]